MSDNNIHSTGRGGAGNIGPDDTVYVDGEIVREGITTDAHGGRGGAGNIAPSPKPSPHIKPTAAGSDAIPEPAMRGAEGYENFHTGRGGEGNIHRERFGGHSGPQKEKREGEGLVEKAKHAVGLDKGKKEQEGGK